MIPVTVTIDLTDVRDWAGFHDAFRRALGFPDYYGRNMDAWIDCMTYIDDSDCGMTSIHVPPGGCLRIAIRGAKSFRERVPDISTHLISACAFVQERLAEDGAGTRLELELDG